MSVESTFTSLHDLSGSDDIPTQMSLLYSIYARICAKEKEKSNDIHNLARSKDRIDRTFKDYQLTVSSLANELRISEVYFRRLFAEKYGTSPSKYIRAIRISHAKELLRHSQLSINECASECGFSSAQYFCRAFKEITSMTPNEYRKKKFRGI
jgi:AraC-like DNA-binding protein